MKSKKFNIFPVQNFSGFVIHTPPCDFCHIMYNLYLLNVFVNPQIYFKGVF